MQFRHVFHHWDDIINNVINLEGMLKDVGLFG